MTDKPAKPPKQLLGIFNILPEDEDTNLEELIVKVKETIKQFSAEIESYNIEEVAYGLKKIVARIVFPENIEGGTQPIEDAISGIPLVQRAECDMVSNLGTKVNI